MSWQGFNRLGHRFECFGVGHPLFDQKRQDGRGGTGDGFVEGDCAVSGDGGMDCFQDCGHEGMIAQVRILASAHFPGFFAGPSGRTDSAARGLLGTREHRLEGRTDDGARRRPRGFG